MTLSLAEFGGPAGGGTDGIHQRGPHAVAFEFHGLGYHAGLAVDLNPDGAADLDVVEVQALRVPSMLESPWVPVPHQGDGDQKLTLPDGFALDVAPGSLTLPFDALERDLYLTATDLDSGERIVLGDADSDWSNVPVSKAVECSTALPMVYEPVEVNGRTLIDGGIYSTTNVDVAVERGAKFIVVINPIVPYLNDRDSDLPTVSGQEVRRIAEMGVPAIANQTFRLLLHQRLHGVVDFWKEKYPGVDIVLFEPELDDELMFGTSIMNYSHRMRIASHGFETVTARLADDYEHLKEVTERHGLEISATRLRRVVRKVREQESSDASVWRRIFDQTTGSLLRQTGSS